jgi:Transposase
VPPLLPLEGLGLLATGSQTAISSAPSGGLRVPEPRRRQDVFTRWFWRATHSRLKPTAAVAKLIQHHLPNLLTYLRHRLTNAGLEGGNAAIQWVTKTARGFRNADHFKTAIHFRCGGLDLYPHEAGRAMFPMRLEVS